MGFIDKIRNNLRNESSTKTGWENMEPAPSQPEARAENFESEASKKRQRDKLIQVLKVNGSPDLAKIAGEPEPGGEHDEDIVLAKIAYGKTTSEDFESILDSIKGPLTDRFGEPNEKAISGALGRMSEDNHQLKMLQHAINGNPNEYAKTSIEDVEAVVQNFSNPMQFEAKMEPFMTFLAEHNSPQKVAEYESALKALERNLFGKKFEYFERMKELAADSAKIFGAPEKSLFTPKEIPNLETPNTEIQDAEESTFKLPNVEREKSHESLIKGGSEYQISRAQAISGRRAEMGQRLEFDNTCEDSSFVDLDAGLFGVFDGTGGHVGGARASRIGAETIADLMQKNGEPKTPIDLADWLDEAHRRVREEPSASYSTATLAKVIEREGGKKAVIYASVGDTRLYIIHPNGRAELVTEDEGIENKIWNGLGYDNDKVCHQTGYRELNPGDKIMLCSDGITGDKGTDLMSEDEVGATVMSVDTAYAAQALVNRARKSDDRTAIVAEV